MEKNRFEYRNSVNAATWGIMSPIIVAIALSIISAIVVSIAGISSDELQNNTTFNIITNLCVELSFLFVAYIIARQARINIFEASGIKTKSHYTTYILGISFGLCALLLLNPIISCWEELLKNVGYHSGDLAFDLNSVGNLFLALILYALVPAICEETLFRGVLLNGLRKAGALPAILISAVAFAVMHMSLAQLPYVLVLGIVLGIVMYYTRNLALTISMHFANNALVLIIGYLTQNASYDITWVTILIGIACAGIFGIVLKLYYNVFKNREFPKIKESEENYLSQQQLPTQRGILWATTIALASVCYIIFVLMGFKVI